MEILPLTLVYHITDSRCVKFYFEDRKDISINWGDGEINKEYEHNYQEEGEYTVQITGKFKRISLEKGVKYLVKCTSFGSDSIGLTSLHSLFRNCINLIEVPKQIPSSVTDISWMFRGAFSFNSDIGDWNVSNVTNMNTMFHGAFSFNSDISTWDVSNVTNMDTMFHSAHKFNSDISSWDTSNVTNMYLMFAHTHDFNSDISSWDTNKVIDMESMFYEASSFNRDISNWDIRNVKIRKLY